MFHLSKWYLDCVTGDGRVFLAYRAELRWRRLHLHYASVLDGDSVLHETPPPRERDGVWEWEAPALGVLARWQPLDPPVRRMLIGGVDWDCCVPRGRAEVRLGGECLRGLGYVEHLALAIPPWRLPVQELRWGRFLGETTGLVWIEWRGPHPLEEAFLNGAPAERAALDALVLDRGLVLRDGPLAAFLSPLSKVLPARILQLREIKWCSRGSLGDSAGWAIHEVVEWP